MDRLLDLARLTSRAGAWFGGALVVLAAFMISADVIMRKLLDMTLGGASELSGYVLAISTTWAFALTLLDRAHVRIDSLYTLLPVRICAALDLLALLAFMVWTALLSWQGWVMLSQSIQRDAHSLTPLATPLAIPQALWLAGLVFFLIVMGLLMARALLLLRSGRLEDVHRLLGSRTALQELEEAVAEQERYRDA